VRTADRSAQPVVVSDREVGEDWGNKKKAVGQGTCHRVKVLQHRLPEGSALHCVGRGEQGGREPLVGAVDGVRTPLHAKVKALLPVQLLLGELVVEPTTGVVTRPLDSLLLLLWKVEEPALQPDCLKAVAKLCQLGLFMAVRSVGYSGYLAGTRLFLARDGKPITSFTRLASTSCPTICRNPCLLAASEI